MVTTTTISTITSMEKRSFSKTNHRFAQNPTQQVTACCSLITAYVIVVPVVPGKSPPRRVKRNFFAWLPYIHTTHNKHAETQFLLNHRASPGCQTPYKSPQSLPNSLPLPQPTPIIKTIISSADPNRNIVLSFHLNFRWLLGWSEHC